MCKAPGTSTRIRFWLGAANACSAPLVNSPTNLPGGGSSLRPVVRVGAVDPRVHDGDVGVERTAERWRAADYLGRFERKVAEGGCARTIRWKPAAEEGAEEAGNGRERRDARGIRRAVGLGEVQNRTLVLWQHNGSAVLRISLPPLSSGLDGQEGGEETSRSSATGSAGAVGCGAAQASAQVNSACPHGTRWERSPPAHSQYPDHRHLETESRRTDS